MAGGGTGFVGDPGGKSEERSLLTEEQLEANLAGIQRQLARFVEFAGAGGPTGALLVNNADWLQPMSLFNFLRDVGKHFTVNQMVAKDSVRSRLDRADQGISYTEFSYMLLQAYDFLQLYDDFGCTLQIGGSDQWGNITMGIELIRKVRRAEAFGLTTPLVLKADGTKFGKTESGAVWLDAARTSPYQLYQFFLRSEDAVVGTYLRYFTFLPHEEILALDAATAEHPGAARGPPGAGPAGLHAGPRRRRDRPGRAGRGRALRGRPRRRSTSAPCSTCSPRHRPPTCPRPARRRRARSWSTSWPRRAWSSPRARPGPTVSQGGAYVNNGREDDVDRRVTGQRPGGRPLPGAAPGQEGPPPGPLRLTGGGLAGGGPRGSATVRVVH